MEVVPVQLVSQLLEHVPEDQRVHILSQHVEQEPITHLAPPHDGVDHVLAHQPIPHPQQVHAHPWRKYYNYSIDHR